MVTLPDGTESTDDRVLSDWLGRRVALCRAGLIDAPYYENPLDFERDQDWIVFEGPAGRVPRLAPHPGVAGVDGHAR